jgi:hypothetical protein
MKLIKLNTNNTITLEGIELDGYVDTHGCVWEERTMTIITIDCPNRTTDVSNTVVLFTTDGDAIFTANELKNVLNVPLEVMNDFSTIPNNFSCLLM